MSKNNIIKILLKNKRVNNYTKMMILLSNLNYFEDYYIPNKKLMNMLNINKNRVIILLHQLEEDNIIRLCYKKRKRYFLYLKGYEEEEKKDITERNLYDYNWLEEGDNDE